MSKFAFGGAEDLTLLLVLTGSPVYVEKRVTD